MPGTNKLFVRNTIDNLALIEKLMLDLSAPSDYPGRFMLKQLKPDTLLLFDQGTGDTWRLDATSHSLIPLTEKSPEATP